MSWTILVASLTVLFSVISYVLTRRRELAWRRTEFICAQAQYFDTDEELREVVRILEERHSTITIEMVFDPASQLDSDKRMQYKQKFDKMFNFLWRLCYAHTEVKTLSRKEVEGFGWYFWKVSKYSLLVDYCENNGYEEINTLTKKLKLDQDN
jgi:hypothetical protein